MWTVFAKHSLAKPLPECQTILDFPEQEMMEVVVVTMGTLRHIIKSPPPTNPDALPITQWAVSKHLRQCCRNSNGRTIVYEWSPFYHIYMTISVYRTHKYDVNNDDLEKLRSWKRQASRHPNQSSCGWNEVSQATSVLSLLHSAVSKSSLCTTNVSQFSSLAAHVNF